MVSAPDRDHSSTTDHRSKTVTLVGFGEAAGVFVDVIRASGWDGTLLVAFVGRPPSRASRERVERAGLRIVEAVDACQRSDVIVSLVTPSSALSVATDLAVHAERDATYVDLTSTGPGTAQSMDAAFAPTPARFVKGAILGPVPLQRRDVPLVFGGDRAGLVADAFGELGFRSVTALGSVTDPATLKMLWSVVTKGVIALYAESLVAAERLGMADAVRTLLASNFGAFGSAAMVERLLLSSIYSADRRVVEMQESRSMLHSVGVESHAVDATVAWLEVLGSIAGATDSLRAQDGTFASENVARTLSDAIAAVQAGPLTPEPPSAG